MTTSVPVPGLSEDLVRAVMAAFYADVRADAVLGPVFKAAIGDGDWSAHIDRVVSFWLRALRIRQGYHAQNFMPAHLRHSEITAELGPRWLDLFQRTTARLCTPEQAKAFDGIAKAMIENLQISLEQRDRT